MAGAVDGDPGGVGGFAAILDGAVENVDPGGLFEDFVCVGVKIF